MIEDTARYFRLMREWAARQPEVKRLLKIDILPERMDQAMAELDEIISTWADKYHTSGGQPIILQMIFGTKLE